MCRLQRNLQKFKIKYVLDQTLTTTEKMHNLSGCSKSSNLGYHISMGNSERLNYSISSDADMKNKNTPHVANGDVVAVTRLIVT
jgi:hypothetical protein